MGLMISWSGLLNQLSLLSFRDCGPLHEIPEHRIFNERGKRLVGFKCTICDHEDAKFLPAKGSSCSLEVVRARYQKHLKDAHDGNELKCHLCSSAFKEKEKGVYYVSWDYTPGHEAEFTDDKKFNE